MRQSQRLADSGNLFKTGVLKIPQFTERVNELITGERLPVQNPKNP